MTPLLSIILAGLCLGLAIRRIWANPRTLLEAESLWHSGAPGAQVLRRLDSGLTARGELGYRIQLLRALASLEAGDRTGAWQASFRAGLVRLPFWRRWPVLAYMATQKRLSPKHRLDLGGALGRRLGPGHRLHHYLAVLAFRAERRDLAWAWMLQAQAGCQEDPLVQEDLMVSALGALYATEEEAELRPTLEQLFESSLACLRHRHGQTRCAWDRSAPMGHLMACGRWADVLSLAGSLPRKQRPARLWEAEALALRELGSAAGATQATLEGLEEHPDSFRLWMELYGHTLQRREEQRALKALERARPLIEHQEDATEAQWEWLLRRAEYAFWIEGNAAQAWSFLSGVPQHRQGGHHPPLHLQILSALGRCQEIFPEVEALLERQPEDLELLMLQADCMAGMGAWEALLPLLDSFKTEGADRSDYWHLLGLTHAHLKNRIPAREYLERACAMDPDHLRFNLDAGHACMELAEWDRGEYYWRRALRLDPRCEEALIQLSETRRALHDRSGAKAILRECLLAHPESEDAQSYLAELEAN